MPSARLRLHVSTGCGFAGRIEVAAELRARRQLVFRPRLQPTDPVVPPTTRFFVRTCQPCRRLLASLGRHPVASLVLRRGIDHAGNMPAGAENKTSVAAEQACRAVGRSPRPDAIFHGPPTPPGPLTP